MLIEQGARIIIQDWLFTKPDDVIHLITDETKLLEVDALARVINNLGAIPRITILPSKSIQVGLTIDEMKDVLSYATAIVGITSYSFVTTAVIKHLLRQGARFISIPMHMTNGGSLLKEKFLAMDPLVAYRTGLPMLRCMRGANTLHITTRRGTDIHFDIRGRTPGIFYGMAHRNGACTSASFEVYIPPNEIMTNGRVILDGSMGYIGLVEKPLELAFKDGYLSYIEPTVDGCRLKDYLDKFNDYRMYYASEVGIGLNRLSRCRGISYVEDESTYGTFHIGLGRNITLGGKHNANGHFDIVIHQPTIMTENAVIMKDGESCLRF